MKTIAKCTVALSLLAVLASSAFAQGTTGSTTKPPVTSSNSKMSGEKTMTATKTVKMSMMSGKTVKKSPVKKMAMGKKSTKKTATKSTKKTAMKSTMAPMAKPM